MPGPATLECRSEFRQAGEDRLKVRQVTPSRLRASTIFAAARRLPTVRPGAISGTALRAPDPAHLAAGERRGIHPVPHLTASWRPRAMRLSRGRRGGPSGHPRVQGRHRRRQKAKGQRHLGRQPAGSGDLRRARRQGCRHHPPVPPPASARVAPGRPPVQAGRPGPVPAPLPRRRSLAALRVSEDVKSDPEAEAWARGIMREAASARPGRGGICR